MSNRRPAERSKTHENADAHEGIEVCKVERGVICRGIEERDGKCCDEDGHVHIRDPCCERRLVNAYKGSDSDRYVLRSFANQTLPSTRTGVAIFFGTLTFVGTELIA